MPDIDLRDPSVHEVMRSWQGYCTRGNAHRDGYNSGLQVPTGHLYVVDHVNVFNMDTSTRGLIMATVARAGGGDSNSTSQYSYGNGEDHFLNSDYDMGNRIGFSFGYHHYYTNIGGRTKLTASDRNTPIYLESGHWLSFWTDTDDADFMIHVSYRDFF